MVKSIQYRDLLDAVFKYWVKDLDFCRCCLQIWHEKGDSNALYITRVGPREARDVVQFLVLVLHIMLLLLVNLGSNILLLK